MILEKSRFGYILWFLYAIVTGVSLGILLAVTCMEAGYSLWIGILADIIFLSIEAFLVWYFYHRIANRLENTNRKQDKSKRRIFECVGVLLLLAAQAAIPAASVFSAPEESYYYDVTKVVAKGEIPQVVQGSAYLYMRLLRFIFLVFGNHIEAGYWLQIVLIFGAFVTLYFAVRKMAGAIPSFCMLLFAVISPTVHKEALTLSPIPLFFCLYGLGLLAVAFCLESGGQIWGKWLFAGIGIGLLTYLDMLGVTLLLFAVGIFMARKTGTENGLKKSLTLFLASCIGAALSFTGAVFADALLSKKNLISIFLAMGEIYKPHLPEMLLPATIGSLPFDMIILLCIMVFGIFSFWCNHWSDELAVWVLGMLGALVLFLFQMTRMSSLLWSCLFMSVMAGVGISNLFKIRQVTERENEKRTMGESGGIRQMQPDSGIKEKEGVHQSTQMDEKLEENREGGTVTVEFEGKTREVRLLDNPLPLPKKKAHKAMDFDYEVSEDDDYDI